MGARRGLLRHGPHRRCDPADRMARRRSARCRAGAPALPQLHRHPGRGPLGRSERHRTRRPRQGARLRTPQVDGWTARFRNAHTDDVPDFEPTMAWLAENQPDDVANCVIHNDFKLDNVVLDHDDPTRVIGILDWEMATLGDPLMDVAGSMAYWIQADDPEAMQPMRRVPTHLPGMITRAEFVEKYCERMGFDMTPERWRWYEVFGLFRAGVIAQQIYYRYYHGQTTNKAFERLGYAVGILGGRLDELLPD
ncbi:phosphotransferase family protein [Gordonia terrae]